MSKAWLSEDDPWLVPAMEVTSTVNRGEAELIKAVGKAMDEYLKQAATNLGLDNLTAAAGDIPDVSTAWPPPQLWVQLVEQYVLPVVQQIFMQSFEAAVSGVAASVDLWVQAHIATVKDRLSPSKWPAMAFEYVRDLVSQAVDQGKSPQELANELKQVLSIGGTVDGRNVWEFDARRIARTETIGAYNSGTYNGAVAWQQATGQTRYKQWLATSDSRTRETHAIANHQIQPFGERFSVGGFGLQYPGDPTGPAQEVIQCRCALNILSEAEAQRALIASSIEGKTMTDIPPPQWRGVLAPLDAFSGDDRILGTTKELRVRDFKKLRYLPADWGAHDGAIGVGIIDRAWIEDGNLMGEGRFDLNDPMTETVVQKMRDGFVGGVSVDLDDFTAEVACVNEAGEIVECDEATYSNSREVLHMTDWRLSGATLVDIPAFPEAFITLVEENLPTEDAFVAAAVGAAGLPLADREREWDGSAAAQRVADWARGDREDIDPEKYRRAFFYYTPEQDATNVGAYKLGFADYIDGQLVAIPRGIFAVAAALEGSRGGVDIPEADVEPIRSKVSAYYRAMAEKFDDPSIVAPWDREGMSEEADAVVAAGAVPNLAPREWFEQPDLDRPTPVTVSNPNEQGYRRVFGHIAAKDVCHTGIEASKRQCVTVPESPSGYAMFNRTPYETSDGVINVGRITTAHGHFANACDCCPGSDDHACLRFSFNQALAHHDKMTVLAKVVVGEDEFGVWCAGVAADDLSQEDNQVLARERVSGDWRGGELIEVLALAAEEPGFPIPRAKVRDGSTFALVAAGAIVPDEMVAHNEPEFDMGKAVKDMVAAELARTNRANKVRAEMREIRAEAMAQDLKEVF